MATDALRFTAHRPMKAGSSAWAPQRNEEPPSSGMASEAWARATETELILEAQKGSRTAFEALVRQAPRKVVLRLALRLTGSEQDAQDIHQEAFLKAYRYLANFRFECSFYTWIYRIVTNLCLDHCGGVNPAARSSRWWSIPAAERWTSMRAAASALASILAMRPEILVIDEPTTGQDWRNAQATMRTLEALNRDGLTIVFVTHDSRLVAEHAQRVVVMAEGSIIADGDPSKVFHDRAVMQRASIRPPPIMQLVAALHPEPACLGVRTVADFRAAWAAQ